MKRNHNSPSLSEKLKIVRNVESGKTRDEVFKTYRASESTYHRVVKKKEALLSQCSGGQGKLKRVRGVEFPEVEQCVVEWVKQTSGKKTVPINGILLKHESSAYGEAAPSAKSLCAHFDPVCISLFPHLTRW